MAAFFALLHLEGDTVFLSHVSRQVVTALARLLGLEAEDLGGALVFGKVSLPWTEDCSGINMLVMFLGITLWVNRYQNFGLSFIVRLILCFPSALIANSFRTLTFVAYRHAFYPGWESQQLHYFIGFVWIMPFLVMFVPDFRHKDRTQWLEIFYMAVVLALVTPIVHSPGGSVVAICALFYLANNCIGVSTSTKVWSLYALWVCSAVIIGWSRMESLWIPWLLVCPRLVSTRILFSFSGFAVLLGTVSLLAMWRQWQIALLVAIGFQTFRFLKKRRPIHKLKSIPLRKLEMYILAALLTAPFILDGLIGINHEVEHPPSGIMIQQQTANSYKLRITGQPPEMSIYWYGAYREGRHHSLVTCMSFRGIKLETVKGEKDVLTDNSMWMREFFIHDMELCSTFPEYMLETFSPFSPPGVHVIVEAPSHLMGPAYFTKESERIVKQLHHLYIEQSKSYIR